MTANAYRAEQVTIEALTPDRWGDLEELFGSHGAYGGCWCMWWRIKRSEFDRNHGEGNRRAFKAVVDSGAVPGILAYVGGKPAGWCSVAPREQFPVLDRSPLFKPFDDASVWSIVCFFIPRNQRQKGLSTILIRGAIEHARQGGARILEAYPVDREDSKNSSLDAFTGFARTFLRLGFEEAIRRSARRPVLRYYL